MTSKHSISSKKWLLLFALSVLLLAAGLAAFNVLTDPFGAFGDPVMQWWSYDETNNPRVAKHSYLKQHHDQYDSYIIGCSSTSSFPTQQLEEYFGGKFYNMIMYGADMQDVEQFSRYLIEHYTVKNLVLNVYIDNGISCGDEPHPLTHAMPWQVDGSSPLRWFGRFLFADPRYGWDKLQKYRTDSMVQAAHDVFDVSTGAYDKSRRDTEHIGRMDDYLADYPVFADYPQHREKLRAAGTCMEHIAAIRDLCRERGVNFTVVTAPVYYDYLLGFDQEEVTDFYTSLAEVTPYWDFTASSVSREPRYFYDATHFRNSVGRMALARIAGDTSVYVPEDFGVYVTRENAREVTANYWTVPEPRTSDYTAGVPVLMYHHLSGDTLPAEQFHAQIAALAGAGYTSVTFDDLRGYVERGEELPEKPVVITFDDGYLSNMELGFPILQQYGMKATIFPIGCSVGKDTYKDTGVEMTPHFSITQAQEMAASGLIQFGSHGYDIHEVEGRDADPVRRGILRREDESEEDYVSFLKNDCQRFNALMEPVLGGPAEVMAYPYGLHSELSSIVLHEMGFSVTLTTDPGTNTIIKGLPQSLLDMNRYSVDGTVTAQQLLEMIG